MPLDWSLFVPVICVQKGTRYDGECYMERIRDVVELNGRSVSKSDSLAKSDFRSGDAVIIRFQKSHFSGVVDFTKEKETMAKCVSGSPHSRNNATSLKVAPASTTEVENRATTVATTVATASPVKVPAPGTSPAAKKRPRSQSLVPSYAKRSRRPSGAFDVYTRTCT